MSDSMNSQNGGVDGSDDPAAEFLAREQATLSALEDDFVLTTNGETHSGEIVPNGDSSVGQNGYNDGYSSDSSRGPPIQIEPKVEPEKIKKWREDQEKMLKQKDAAEEVKKEELRSQSKKEVEEWYARYAEQLEKSKLNNRNAEKEWIAERDQETPGQEWEKITKMCDFNPKSARNTKDTSRMRSILLQLKQSPPAPSFSANVSKK